MLLAYLGTTNKKTIQMLLTSNLKMKVKILKKDVKEAHENGLIKTYMIEACERFFTTAIVRAKSSNKM